MKKLCFILSAMILVAGVSFGNPMIKTYQAKQTKKSDKTASSKKSDKTMASKKSAKSSDKKASKK